MRPDLEGRRRRLTPDAIGDGADRRVGAGFHHAYLGAAADHAGSHEHGVGGVLNIGCVGLNRPRPFLDGIGLAGQQRLLDE